MILGVVAGLLLACATLGPVEQQDLTALDACGADARLRDNVAGTMTRYRLSMPDAVLGLELVGPLRAGRGMTVSRAEGDFIARTGLTQDPQSTLTLDECVASGAWAQCLEARG